MDKDDYSKKIDELISCYFSEEELDKEIRLPMRSDNATQSEAEAVFCR